MCSKMRISGSTGTYSDQIRKMKQTLAEADTVVIGAGAGLSAAAGYVYTGENFRKYFARHEKRYGFHDMYSGGFYPYETMEQFWGYWAVYIWINRYAPIPSDEYKILLDLVKDKDYFVITTNVDHCFQRAGFDRKRLFYTQGDYGLLQDHEGKEPFTYDNEDIIRDMVLSLGWEIDENNGLVIPEGKEIKMEIPSELVPCDHTGRPMKMNLRSDDTFVEDEGWHEAARRYGTFLNSRHGKTMFLELGVGYNTPVIIKYPFWNMTAKDPDAVYVCINYGEAVCPGQISDRSICISADIGKVLADLK